MMWEIVGGPDIQNAASMYLLACYGALADRRRPTAEAGESEYLPDAVPGQRALQVD